MGEVGKDISYETHQPSEAILGENPHAALRFEDGKRGIEKANQTLQKRFLDRRVLHKVIDFLYPEQAK